MKYYLPNEFGIDTALRYREKGEIFLLQDKPYNLNTVKKMIPLETKCIMVIVNNLMSKYIQWRKLLF